MPKMVLNVWSLSGVELLQFVAHNLCGFDLELEAGSRWAIKSNLVISLVPWYYNRKNLVKTLHYSNSNSSSPVQEDVGCYGGGLFNLSTSAAHPITPASPPRLVWHQLWSWKNLNWYNVDFYSWYQLGLIAKNLIFRIKYWSCFCFVT